MSDTSMTRPPEAVTGEFHAAFDLPLATTPTMPPIEDRVTRARLHVEETAELVAELVPDHPEAEALINQLAVLFIARALPTRTVPDLAAILRELGDSQYVNGGTANVHGLPLTRAFLEIHRANMAKLGPDGRPRYSEHGKVLKPEGWQPPDIAAVLAGVGAADHVVRVIADFQDVRLKLECHAPDGATCRRTCARPGCDWEEPYPHRGEDGTEHGVGDMGECNAVLWVEADDTPLAEYHDRSADGEPVYDGMPVHIDWIGGDFEWRGIRTVTPQAVTA